MRQTKEAFPSSPAKAAMNPADSEAAGELGSKEGTAFERK